MANSIRVQGQLVHGARLGVEQVCKALPSSNDSSDYGCGIWAGKLFCICVIVDYLIFLVLEMFAPRSRIDICKDWPKKAIQPKPEVNKRYVRNVDDDTGVLRKRSSRYRKPKREVLEDR